MFNVSDTGGGAASRGFGGGGLPGRPGFGSGYFQPFGGGGSLYSGVMNGPVQQTGFRNGNQMMAPQAQRGRAGMMPTDYY